MRNRTNSRSTSTEGKRKLPLSAFHLLALSTLFLILAVIYAKSFQAPFVLDDLPNIVEKSEIHLTDLGYRNLHDVIFKGANSKRMLPNLSFALNYYFGGENVWGYHLVNLAVHIFCAMVLYSLAFTTLTLPRLGFSSRRAAEISLISALVWASHPVQTNGVTYIVQRMTGMATLFYLSSLLLYVKGRLQPETRRRYALWAASAGCGLFAMTSKEISAMLPAIIPAYEFYFLRDEKSWIKSKKGLLISGIAVLCVGLIGWIYIGNISFFSIFDRYATRDFTLSERLMTESRVIIHYLSLIPLPLPSRLNFDYDYGISHSLLDPPVTLAAGLSIVGLIWLLLVLYRRQRLLSFGLLWFLANLLIESSVVPLELIFEHRLYLPSSLLIVSLVAASSRWWRMHQSRLRLAWTAMIIVLCLFTWQRNLVWASKLTLWQDVVNKSPGKDRGYNNLGIAYAEMGNFSKAVIYYKKAAELNPFSNSKAYYNLGKAYLLTGQIAESIEALQNAIKISPSFSDAYYNLGLAYLKKGSTDAAIEAFERVVATEPYSSTAWFYLGSLYLISDRLDESITALREAIRLDPSSDKALFKLARAYFNKGETEQSIKTFQQAIKVNPSYSKAYFNLGTIYLNTGRIDEAIEAFKGAIKTDPSYARAYFNLGRAYRQRGLSEESEKVMRKARALAKKGQL